MAFRDRSACKLDDFPTPLLNINRGMGSLSDSLGSLLLKIRANGGIQARTKIL